MKWPLEEKKMRNAKGRERRKGNINEERKRERQKFLFVWGWTLHSSCTVLVLFSFLHCSSPLLLSSLLMFLPSFRSFSFLFPSLHFCFSSLCLPHEHWVTPQIEQSIARELVELLQPAAAEGGHRFRIREIHNAKGRLEGFLRLTNEKKKNIRERKQEEEANEKERRREARRGKKQKKNRKKEEEEEKRKNQRTKNDFSLFVNFWIFSSFFIHIITFLGVSAREVLRSWTVAPSCCAWFSSAAIIS